MGECTILKALIEKAKSNKSKGCRKGGEKRYTKHKVLIEKKLKKAFTGRKKSKQELRTFEKIEVPGSEESDQSLNDSDASSKSDDSWSLGSNESYLDNIKHSRKKLKKNSENFLTISVLIPILTINLCILVWQTTLTKN